MARQRNSRQRRGDASRRDDQSLEPPSAGPTAPPRRLVEELRTEVRLEGTPVVIVEGPSDALVIGRWLADHFGRSVAVYEIDSLELPPDDDHLDDRRGMRAKALSMARRHLLDTDPIRVVVDRDLNAPDEPDPPRGFYTDYPGIESYAAAEEFLRDAVGIAVLAGEEQQEERRRQLSPLIGLIVRQLYCLRHLHADGDCRAAFPKVMDGMLRTDRTLDVGWISRRAQLDLATAQERCGRCTAPEGLEEARAETYGHDLGAVVFEVLKREFRSAGLTKVKAVERIVLGFLIGKGQKSLDPGLGRRIRDWLADCGGPQAAVCHGPASSPLADV